jgi:hypothetical protein
MAVLLRFHCDRVTEDATAEVARRPTGAPTSFGPGGTVPDLYQRNRNRTGRKW